MGRIINKHPCWDEKYPGNVCFNVIKLIMIKMRLHKIKIAYASLTLFCP